MEIYDYYRIILPSIFFFERNLELGFNLIIFMISFHFLSFPIQKFGLISLIDPSL